MKVKGMIESDVDTFKVGDVIEVKLADGVKVQAMSRVYTFNGKMVATNRHKATEQTTDSLEEFRQRQPNDVCNLKVKEHHPTYRNMNRNYPGSVFLVGNQVHVMQGIAGSKDGEATTYKDTNANSIAAGKCKFVAKNSGILFV